MKISRAKATDAEGIARVEMASGYLHDKTFGALRHARSILRDKKEHLRGKKRR